MPVLPGVNTERIGIERNANSDVRTSRMVATFRMIADRLGAIQYSTPWPQAITQIGMQYTGKWEVSGTTRGDKSGWGEGQAASGESQSMDWKGERTS